MLDAQRGKGNAGSRARFGRGEVQAHGVVARAGHGRVGRLHSGVVRAPVLARPRRVGEHDVRHVSAVAEEREINLDVFHALECRLVHGYPVRVLGHAVPGTRVGGQLADPFVVDVRAGNDAVVRRGVALLRFDRLTVHANFVHANRPAGQRLFAVLQTDGRERNAARRAFGRTGEVKAYGVGAFAGNRRLGHLHALRRLRAVVPPLVVPVGVGIHQECRRERFDFARHGRCHGRCHRRRHRRFRHSGHAQRHRQHHQQCKKLLGAIHDDSSLEKLIVPDACRRNIFVSLRGLRKRFRLCPD